MTNKSTGLVNGGAFLLLGNLSTTALNFLALLILANILSPENFGLFTLLTSIIMFGAVIGRGGIENTLLYLIPRNSDDKVTIRMILRTSFLWVTILSLISITIVLFIDLNAIFGIKVTPYITVIMIILSISIFFEAIMYLTLSANRALLNYKQSVIPLVTNKGIYFIFLTFLFLLCYLYNFSGNNLLLIASLIYLCSFVISGLLSYMLYRGSFRKYKSIDLGGYKKRLYFDVIKSAPTYMSTSIVNKSFNTVLLIVLGILLSTESVGIYKISMNLAIFTAFILTSITGVIAPLFSKSYKNNDMVQLGVLYQKSTKWIISISMPVALILLLSSKQLLSLFGDYYEDYQNILIILLIGQFFNVIVGSVGFLLMMTGYKITNLLTNIMTIVLSMILMFILVPYFELSGAAFSVSLGIIIINISKLIIVKKKLNLFPYNKEYWRLVPCTIISLILGFIYINFFTINNDILNVTLVSIIVIISYFCALLFFGGLTIGEKNTISDYLNALKKTLSFKKH
ncbi:oligosaccharide flippase family protein [Virgibacillus doumboii]|uniref:oligosaccharide flippase family protein n=1 Tax=Virgibacillus doumboii TaxID=2697503 RepID=UPI001FEBA85E|nr:oligosaccharide flippase family protein [Virgibacillus doumboii]